MVKIKSRSRTFLSTKLFFRALLKPNNGLILISGKFFEKKTNRTKKTVYGNFLEVYDQNLARVPSQILF